MRGESEASWKVEGNIALTVTVALAVSSWLRLRGRERARR